jgi:hypothetical protein
MVLNSKFFELSSNTLPAADTAVFPNPPRIRVAPSVSGGVTR